MADVAARPSPSTVGTRPVAVPRLDQAARLRLWRAAWSPFWAWSDVPVPDLARREAAPPAAVGPAGQVFLSGLDAVRRRLWLRHALHALFRAVWLAVAGAAVWMAGSLLLAGPALALRPLGTAVVAALLVGVVFALVAKPSRRQTARMLDRTFGLQERLATAVEHLGRGVPAAGESASVTYLQMADAANVMDELRRHPLLGVRPPTREIVLAVFWALVLAALAFLRGVGGSLPPLAEAVVPPFTPAVERPEAPAAAAAADAEAPALSVEEVLARSAQSAQAQRDLAALAAALADQAVTSNAAEAIRAGDYEGAADDLRELAPDAGQLSEASRGDLAANLDAAAATMAPEGSSLRPASQEAAAGLRAGAQPATEGLRSLAEAVEQTGEQVAPPAELAAQMRQAQQARARGEPGGQGDPSQGAPNQQGAPQAGQDPGSGADAEGQAGEAGQPGDAGGAAAGQPAAGEGAPGEQGSGGEAASPGEGAGASEADAGQPGEGNAGGEAGEAAQGAGAGGESGESGKGDPAGGGGADEPPAAGQAVEERVVEGDGGRGEPGEPGEVTDTISLPPGSGRQGVQTSGDGGSSLIGSGAGVTVGAGDAVQGEVGEAGPDNNHVPPEYRDTVERYFSEPEAPS